MTDAVDRKEVDTRCRIVAQAERFFRTFGYQKTTVADIAKALKMSPANVYRFFDSKKSINEAVGLQLMGEVEAALLAIADSDAPAPDRVARFARTMHEMNASRYVTDRMMHEMVAVALDESWSIVRGHIERVDAMMTRIVADGIAAGDFTVDDPQQASRCLRAGLIKFCHPQIISQCAAGDPGPDVDTMVRFLMRGLGYRGS